MENHKLNCSKLAQYPDFDFYYIRGYYAHYIMVYLALAYYVFITVKDVYLFVYGRITLKKRLRKYGEWAAITGCTGGVGTEYCRQLAALGLNLILIDKVEEEVLASARKELEDEFGIQAHYIICDLRDSSENSFQSIFQDIKELDVGIWINNAGIFYDEPMPYHNLKEQKLRAIVEVNVRAPEILTHKYINMRLSQRRKGLVIFMASLAGVVPVPFASVYSSSKSYIAYMVKTLGLEYNGSDIFIQGFWPSYIVTQMTKYSTYLSTEGLFRPTPRTFVKHALSTFGLINFSTGYYPFEVLSHFSCFVPERVMIKMVKICQYLLMRERKGRKVVDY